MKVLYACLFFSLLIFSLHAQDVKLNETGHIISPNKSIPKPEYSLKNGNPLINYNNHRLKGNAFYTLSNGYLTIESYEASVPVKVRFYNMQGEIQKTIVFNRTYNLAFSPNKEHIIFFDGKNIVTINASKFSTKKHPGSPVFAIDNDGKPTHYDREKRMIVNGDSQFPIAEHPIRILHTDSNTYIFTRNNLFQIEDNALLLAKELDGTFFTANIHSNNLYFVTKQIECNKFVYSLYNYDRSKNLLKIQEREYQRVTKSYPHEAIRSPLKYGQEYAHPIGNSYGAIQDYDGNPYLHPGVDYLGTANENVYAVADGVVKAILTTGGQYNWRIAISNEDTDEESIGYLYAHLIETSFPFAVGDHVKAGDIVGKLVYWPWYEFTHIHFARIKCQGEVWDGAWWTINNPHIDDIDLMDDTPPVFENARSNALFAFRNRISTYLDPMQLHGDVRAIAKVYDQANTHWKIDVYKLRYQIFSEEDTGSPLVDEVSFSYDFKLDTYFSNSYESKILQTIYSRDNSCFSIANYNQRVYYQMVTNTTGDEEINEGDKDIYFDTTSLPDGNYIFKVIAKDASMNQAEASMDIRINNTNTNIDYPNVKDLMVVYPNPAKDFITIGNANGSTFTIVNTIGKEVIKGAIGTNQHIENISMLSNGVYTLIIHGNNRLKQIRIVKI